MDFNKNQDNINFLDGRGRTIKIGSPVKYTGTGTTGFVIDLIFEDCEMWVRLDSTGLTYHASTLLLIDAAQVKVKHTYGMVTPSVENIQEEMKRKLLQNVTGADDRNIIGH